MSMEAKRNLVEKLFNVDKFSPYYIHTKTGIGIKEVYHILKHNEEAKKKHKQAIYDRSQESVIA